MFLKFKLCVLFVWDVFHIEKLDEDYTSEWLSCKADNKSKLYIPQPSNGVR